MTQRVTARKTLAQEVNVKKIILKIDLKNS